MMNQTVQIANYPPVSVAELRAAGIQWHPQRGLGAMPNWMPITQEDKDRLGEVRNAKLHRLKYLAIIALVLSVVSIGIGFGAIMNSAPEYNFPHSMGGGVIIGVIVILYCILIFGMVKEGKKTPTGDTTTSCFRCMTTCNIIFTMFFTSMVLVAVGMGGIWATIDCANLTPEDDYARFSFNGCTPNQGTLYALRVVYFTTCNIIFTMFFTSAVLVAMGMGGIWATIDCANRTPEDDYARFSFNGCTPNQGTLYALGVVTILIGSLLFLLFLTMNCMVCCNYRAFGVKSNYEMFSDYQMLRMQEMNRQMQQQGFQQQQQFYPQGQGQFQGQGQYQGQFQGQMAGQQFPQRFDQASPSAPMLPDNRGYPQHNSDEPPSYGDVMSSGKYTV